MRPNQIAITLFAFQRIGCDFNLPTGSMNFRAVCAISVGLLAVPPWAAAAGELLLTNAAQVRALSAAEAWQHLPARLQGVVVGEAEPQGRALVIDDGTACLYVAGPSSLISQVQPTDLVVVEGTSDPGEFAPIIRVRQLRKVGTGNLPEPQRVTFTQMVNGSLDAQWVKISGVVRECHPTEGNSWQSDMVLETSGHRLAVRINNQHAPGDFVDAEVTLRGFCFSQENNNRQMISPMLLMPHAVPVLVDQPAPPKPYDLPLRSVGSLFRFQPQTSYEHRVHLRGVVTCYRPRNFFWIRDGNDGLRVECKQSERLLPGDKVDVVGFPMLGEYAPVLEDAMFKKLNSLPPPAPVFLTNSASAVAHDADLVCLDARLVQKIPGPDGWTLVFDWNGTTVKGLLRFPPGLLPSSDWRDGSQVRVAGICSVISDVVGPISGVWQPDTFSLLLRSPADLTITQMASWWTPKRTTWALACVSTALTLTIALIVFAARRRLHQTALERSQAEREFSAILKERNRIAREIHDTLAQGLSAISMRLELVRKRLQPEPDGVANELELTHSLVRSSLAEMRNSVWNLHSQVLDNGDLATALKEVLRLLTEGTEVQSEFRVTGQKQRLAPVLENNLLRAGQEAITNAIKHARAKKISVTLEFQKKQVRLCVRDDGQGFDTHNPQPSNHGFGLLGMRERIEESHGQLILQSDAQTGTEVVLQAPVVT